MTKVNANKSVLLVVDSKTPELTRASSNLSKIKLASANYLNVFDVMNADNVVITNAALKVVSEWLAVDAKPVAKPAEVKEAK
jgi:large subunit ribosomal protein L4